MILSDASEKNGIVDAHGNISGILHEKLNVEGSG